MDLSDQLEARSRGLSGSLGRREGAETGLFRQLVPALAKGAGVRHIDVGRRSARRDAGGSHHRPQGRPGSLLRAVAGGHLVPGAGRDVGPGGTRQGVVDSGGLIRSLDDAIGRAPLAFASPPSPAPAAPDGGQRSGATSGATTAAGRRTPREGRACPSAARVPGGAAPKSPGLGTPADGVVQPLVDVIIGLASPR